MNWCNSSNRSDVGNSGANIWVYLLNRFNMQIFIIRGTVVIQGKTCTCIYTNGKLSIQFS